MPERPCPRRPGVRGPGGAGPRGRAACRCTSFRLGVRGRRVPLGLPAGMAVPRGRFDAELVGAAVEAGVRFLPRTEARVEHRGRGADGSPGHLGRRPPASRPGRPASPRGSAPLALPSDSAISVRVARGAEDRDRLLAGRRPRRLRAGDHPHGRGAGRIRRAGPPRRRATARRRGDPAAGAAASSAGRAPRRRPSSREAGLPRRSPGSGRPLARDDRPHPADPSARRDAALLPGGRRRLCRAVHRRGDRLGPGAGRAVAPLALRAIERWEPGLGREWGRLHRRVVGRRQVVCRAAGRRAAAAPARPAPPSRPSTRLPARRRSLARLSERPASFRWKRADHARDDRRDRHRPARPSDRPVRLRRDRPRRSPARRGAGAGLLGDLPPLGRRDATQRACSRRPTDDAGRPAVVLRRRPARRPRQRMQEYEGTPARSPRRRPPVPSPTPGSSRGA